MGDIQIFELSRLAKILGITFAKAKNWTNGRTGVEIKASIREAEGTGSRALYSLTDLYLMGVAMEFSKAGFAAKAIGKLLDAVKPMLTEPVPPSAVWTVWRPKPGGPFRIEAGRTPPPDTTLWLRLEIGALLKRIDQAARRSREAGSRAPQGPATGRMDASQADFTKLSRFRGVGSSLKLT
jgi:hypothetical protein